MEGVDLESIRMPGGNVIFLVFVVFVWWRNRLGTDMRNQSWVDAVTDITWVLGQLTDGYEDTPPAASTPWG